MSRVIYVAGKYRDKSKSGICKNIEHARREAVKLWQAGWVVICPHCNSALFDRCPDDVFLKGGLELVRRSDAIFMLSNWKESKGAVTEYALALALNKGIYYEEE